MHSEESSPGVWTRPTPLKTEGMTLYTQLMDHHISQEKASLQIQSTVQSIF